MKIKKGLAKFLAIIMMFATVSFASGTKIYDEQMLAAEEIALQLLNEGKEDNAQVVYSYNLEGLDGENDFILVTGQYDGYAIFTREDLSLVEYSPYGASPFQNVEKSESRYAGPANYFVEDSLGVKNLQTKEIISKDKLTEVASQVRLTAKKPVADVEIPVVKDEVSTMSASIGGSVATPFTSIGDGGADVKDPDKYTVVSRKLISDYQYFLANPYYGYNATGTCSSVAAQLLLSYNNWSKFGKLITNPDFLCANADYSKPYSKEVISTTSEDKADDKQSFYEYLVSQIDPLENGAIFINVESGIKKYINNYVASEYRNLINCNRYQLQTQDNMANIIENEIDNDRPLIVSMVAYQSGDNSFYLEKFHAVVVYGYQTFKINGNIVDGYICHTGWDRNINKYENNNSGLGEYNYCWFDKNWLLPSCITLEIDHNHSFIPYTYVQNGQQITDNHILKCASCNSVKTTENHSFDSRVQKNIYDYTTNTSTADKYYHYRKCTCGMQIIERHSGSFEDSYDGTHRIRCNKCAYIMQKEMEHVYKIAGATTCHFCGGGNLW